jgi:hypothetical protein
MGGSIAVYGAAMGIGAGPAAENGRSLVGSLEIVTGTLSHARFVFDPGGGVGAGIATGHAEALSDSVLVWLHIDALAMSGSDFDIATLTDAAGIGAGGANRGQSVLGTLTVTGGSFRVNIAMRGAAVASGCANRGSASVGSIAISGGPLISPCGSSGPVLVVATARGNAGVGGLAITGGSFTSVRGGFGAAAIGGGHTDMEDASVGTAFIRGAEIPAIGGGGASAIGSGTTLAGSAGISALEITSGRFDIGGRGGIQRSPNLTPARHQAGEVALLDGDQGSSFALR